MIGTLYHVGDRVIYRATKRSEHPGPRAADVHPSPKGEEYSYAVDKFWVVAAEPDSGLALRKSSSASSRSPATPTCAR